MSKIQRNAPCPCGSGKKYKKCCLLKTRAKSEAAKQKAAEEARKEASTLTAARVRSAATMMMLAGLDEPLPDYDDDELEDDDDYEDDEYEDDEGEEEEEADVSG